MLDNQTHTLGSNLELNMSLEATKQLCPLSIKGLEKVHRCNQMRSTTWLSGYFDKRLQATNHVLCIK
jgi:hypothetical protein